jgi:membrane protease YdiL (CAAX protease family)
MRKFSSQDNSSPKQEPNITKLSLISGAIWMILGALIIYIGQDRTLLEVFTDGASIWIQITTGTAFGILFGVMGIQLMKDPTLKKALSEYEIIKTLNELKLGKAQQISVSAVAGITEEFLFRAAIQPIIGIWLTSLIFVGVHGYIKITTVPKFLFTLFTFLLSMMLGYLYMAFGLYSAMLAHFVYDVIVLWKHTEEAKKEVTE